MSIIYNSEGLPVRIIKNNQVIHTTSNEALSMLALGSPASEHLRGGFPFERILQPTTEPPSGKRRAESLPRSSHQRSPKNIPTTAVDWGTFNGSVSGWYDKEEALRKKERRELANTGNMISRDNWFHRSGIPKRLTKYKEEEMDIGDIPAAGYSGHVPGLRHIGIGKPFGIAAREAKRHYAMRRRAQSGDRDSSVVSRNSNPQSDSYSETQLKATPNYSHH